MHCRRWAYDVADSIGSGENTEMGIDDGNACYRPPLLFHHGTERGWSIGNRRNMSLAGEGGKLNVVVVDTLDDEVGEVHEYVYPAFVNSDLEIEYRRRGRRHL